MKTRTTIFANLIQAAEDEQGNVTPEDTDAFMEVESDGGGYVNLHINPRTSYVLTLSMSPEDAWRLQRELARGASAEETT